MTPVIVACHFGSGVNDQFPRLARVFEYSARRHLSGWEREIVSLAPLARHNHAHPAYAENTHKLNWWCRIVNALPDGARVLLIDIDTVILRPLDDVWDRSFDLAYTVRGGPGARFPFNMGVVFVRLSPSTRGFLSAWREENTAMLNDEARHRDGRMKYGGINQASFGTVLEQPIARDVQLERLPCVEWNCEDSAWKDFDASLTRILHVKSELRRTAFGVRHSGGGSQKLQSLAQLWLSIEREANRAAA
jgi:hypothetical protein